MREQRTKKSPALSTRDRSGGKHRTSEITVYSEVRCLSRVSAEGTRQLVIELEYRTHFLEVRGELVVGHPCHI